MNRRPVSLADPDYRKMLFGFSTRFGTPPRSFSLWTVIETGDDGIYRSVYPDDGMSTDAANHRERKTSGSPHLDRCCEIYGPLARIRSTRPLSVSVRPHESQSRRKRVSLQQPQAAEDNVDGSVRPAHSNGSGTPGIAFIALQCGDHSCTGW